MGKSFFEEFKAFAMKGNVVDMAVGVIIGAAFGKIVSSLVADVIMPLVGLATGGVHFTELKYVIKEAVEKDGAVVAPAVSINYGNFIQAAVDFIIIAFAIFVVIKILGKLSAKKEEEAKNAPPPAPSPDVVLLTEIRDLLNKDKSQISNDAK